MSAITRKVPAWDEYAEKVKRNTDADLLGHQAAWYAWGWQDASGQGDAQTGHPMDFGHAYAIYAAEYAAGGKYGMRHAIQEAWRAWVETGDIDSMHKQDRVYVRHEQEAARMRELAESERRTARALELTNFNVEQAVSGYLEAKLWTQQDDLFSHADNDIPADIDGVDRTEHGEMLDAFYGPDDIDSEYVDDVRDDLLRLVTAHPLAVRLYMAKRDSSDFGHDYLLTRDGNGTGFWDRGLDELGHYLAEHAKADGPSRDLNDGALCSDPNGIRTFIAGTLY